MIPSRALGSSGATVYRPNRALSCPNCKSRFGEVLSRRAIHLSFSTGNRSARPGLRTAKYRVDGKTPYQLVWVMSRTKAHGSDVGQVPVPAGGRVGRARRSISET